MPHFSFKHYFFKFWPQYLILALLLMIWMLTRTLGQIFNGNALTALVHHNLSAFGLDVLGMLLCTGTFAAFIFVTQTYNASISRRVDNAIREDIATRVSLLDFITYHEHNDADYISWLTNDINLLNQQGFQNLTGIFSDGFLVIVSAVLLASYHLSLLMSVSVFAILMLLFPKVFRQRLNALSTNLSQRNQDLTSKLTDLLEGYNVLLHFGRRSLFQKAVHGYSDEAGQASYQYTRFNTLAESAINLLSVLAQITLIAQAGWLAYHRAVPIGALITIGALTGNVFSGFTSVSYELTTLRSVQPVLDKYNHLTKTQPDGSSQVPKLQNAIFLDHVSFTYPNQDAPIIHQLSLTIKRGEHIALIGASGVGKTTLINLLSGLLPTYTGKLFWDKLDYKKLHLASLRHQITYIDQSPYIFEGSLAFNITLGRKISPQALETVIQKAQLQTMVHQSEDGLNMKLEHNGQNLSGGQRQRIALARSLVDAPSLILADEITTGLDEQHGQEIEKQLLQLKDTAIVLITHHLRPAIAKDLDRVLQLEQKKGETILTNVKETLSK